MPSALHGDQLPVGRAHAVGPGHKGGPSDDHRGRSVLGELEAPARKPRSENDAWRGPSCLVHARTFGSGPGGGLAGKPPPAEPRRPQERGGRAGPGAESGAALPGRSPRCLGRSLLRTCPVVLFQFTGLHLIGRRETRKRASNYKIPGCPVVYTRETKGRASLHRH